MASGLAWAIEVSRRATLQEVSSMIPIMATGRQPCNARAGTPKPWCLTPTRKSVHYQTVLSEFAQREMDVTCPKSVVSMAS